MRKEEFHKMMIIVGLAIVVGFLSARLLYQPRSAIDYELQQLALEGARKAQLIGLAFKVGVLSLIILTLAGVSYQGVRWLARRNSFIYPNESGLFPVIKLRIGGQLIVHDPNRTPTPTTIYTRMTQRTIGVAYVFPDEFSSDQQLQTATQAQLVQAVVGASKKGLNAQSRQLIEQTISARPAVREELPEVVVFEDLGPSHVERLLEDHGDES